MTRSHESAQEATEHEDTPKDEAIQKAEPQEYEVVETQLTKRPDQRNMVVVVVDHSGSTRINGRIRKINNGLQVLTEELRSDERLADETEVAVVRCGGDAEVAVDFTRATQFTPPNLSPGASTPLGEAVNLSLDLILGRYRDLRADNVHTRSPFLYVLSDGNATDDEAVVRKASRRIRRLAGEEEFLNPFAIGPSDANFKTLNRFMEGSPNNALEMESANYADVMKWASKSIRIRSVPETDRERTPNPSDHGLKMV